MTARHRNIPWVIVAITALLLTACNPIPAHPDMLTRVPAPLPAPEREPMQASLHDFAFVMAEIEVGEFEPEHYADAILKLLDCMESEPIEGVDGPYTPGQKAAIQWIAILTAISYYAFEEDLDLGAPTIYNSLVAFTESCLDE